MSQTLAAVKRLVAAGEVRISEHGYDEMANDLVAARDVVIGVATAAVVEDYPDFPKGPSVLVLEFDVNGQPIHVVWGNWGLSRPYDEERFREDEAAMERIIAQEATLNGLRPATLQVMVNQYFLADPLQREVDRHCWARRVMHRRSVDYFPSAYAVLALLHRGGN